MGRKGSFAERPVKGPGRKAKKQGPPVLTKGFKGPPSPKAEDLKLSHRQKQRLVKRQQKKVNKQPPPVKKQIQQKKLSKYDSEESVDEGSDIDDEQSENEMDFQDDTSDSDDENADVQGFTDDNNSWLTPKPNKNGFVANGAEESSDGEEEEEEEDGESGNEMEDEQDSDDEMVDEEGEEEEDDDDEEEMVEDEYDSDDVQVGTLNDFEADDSDVEEQSELDSDDSDNENDSDDDDDEDLLPIEKASKKLKVKKEQEAQLAEDELQMNIEKSDVFTLPDPDDEAEADKPLTLQDIQQRIKDVSLVLSDFKKYRQANRTRSEYVQLLRTDLCTYYSYNEFLMEKLMDIFPLNELMEFLEASEVQRPLTIRTNTLKTRRRDLAQALINRGVNLDPLGKWTKVGLVVYNSSVPLGATPEYLAGHYMIQGASSMLPVMALAPQEYERILDMCAAPGGKSSHIASIMKNTGVLFSNDANADRIKAVVGNFHRLGVVNAVVSCEDGCKFGTIMQGFDRILLDAPCTGTGVVSKDPSVKISKSDVDIQRCYNLQRKLLLHAIDCLNAKSTSGGYLVYSTCSILPEENEWVIDYALKKRNVKLVPTGLEFGTEGFVNYRQFRFHPSMKLTRRYYPHTHNMDGFFVAKLKKFSDVIPAGGNDEEEGEAELDVSQEGVAVENGDSETGQNKRKAAKDLELTAAKKRKREQDEKKYVAKVFEKPVAVKKATDDAEEKKSKKSKKNKTPKEADVAAKSLPANESKPLANAQKAEPTDSQLNGTKSKSKSKKSKANGSAPISEPVAVAVNKSKYLPSAPVETSPNDTPKKKKQKKSQQTAVSDGQSSSPSLKTPKKSPVVSDGVADVKKSVTKTKTPKKLNDEEVVPDTPQSKSKKQIANGVTATPQQQSKTPKKPTVTEAHTTPKQQSKTPKKQVTSEVPATPQQQSKTPKKQVTNGVPATPQQQSKTPKTPTVTEAPATLQQKSKTPKKPKGNEVPATPQQQSKTPKKQVTTEVSATPQQQSKTPKKPKGNEVLASPQQQSKSPKKQVANEVPATPQQQSKTPKKQVTTGVSATPQQQSKTPKKQVANETAATPQPQKKTPKKQIANDVQATPLQSKTPKQNKHTPAAASKTPQPKQHPQTPKTSKVLATENGTSTDKKSPKQNSAPEIQQKSTNQKKNVKLGKVEVDNLSDSFALKVKAKMGKKKPAKKIGNLKPNKKVDESKKVAKAKKR